MANNIKGITVEIGGNTGPLDKALKDVNKTSRDLQGELREVNRQLKLDPTNTTLLAQKQKLLAESVTTTKSKLETLKEAEKQAQQQFKQGKISEEQYRALQREVIKTENKLKNLESQASKSNATLNKISETAGKVGDAAGKIGDKMMPATAAIAGAGAAVGKMSIDFEDGVAKVSTIADESQVSIGDLRKGILKLSDDTGIASTEIANNVYDAISAGQKTGDAINFVSSSTKLAKAGFAEAGQSLDLLTTIMNSYGLDAKEVTKVSDILINTQNLGKITVGELSQSMGKVIPTAKAYNVNLEQVASGYAIMTAKGIKSAETTTYMASMFNELGKSGTKASDTVKKVSGKSFQDLIKSGKTVGDVLAMMDDYAKKNNLSLADLFGSAEAGKASLILSANAGKDFNSMLESMNNTAGATDKAFEKVSNTTGEKLKKSLNQLKNDGIKLGDSVAPIIERISNLAGILAGKLGGLSKEQLDMVVKIGLVIAAISPIAKTVQGITTAAQGLLKVVGLLMAHPIVAIIAGIIAIIVLLVVNIKKLWDTNEGFRNAATSIWNGINKTIETVVNAIVKFFTVTIPNAWNSLVAFFKGIPAWFSELWTNVKTKTENIWNGIKDFFSNLWQGIKDIFNTAVEGICNFVMERYGFVVDGVIGIWEGFKQSIEGLWEVIKNIFLGAILLIVDIVTGNFGKLKTDSMQIWENIKQGFTDIWEGIKTIFSGALSIIATGISNSWNNIKTVTVEIWNSIKDFLSGLWEGTKTLCSDAWTGMKTTVTTISQSIKQGVIDIWNGILDFFRNLPSNLYNLAVSMFTKMKEGVINTTNEVKESAVKVGDGIVDAVKEIPKKMLDIGKNIVEGLADGIENFASNAWDAATGLADGVANKIRGTLGIHSPSRVMMQIGQYITQGLAIGIDSNKGMAVGAIDNVGIMAINKTKTWADKIIGIASTTAKIFAAILNSGESDNSNYDSSSSYSSNSHESEEPEENLAEKISSKYKDAFNRIELAQIELGRETHNADGELKKQQATLDIQKDKLSTLKSKYNEMKDALGSADDEVVGLNKDIASLTIEIENQEQKLAVDSIRNKYNKQLEAIELSTLKLTRATNRFNEELDLQCDLYINNILKLDSMKNEYNELVNVLGKDADEVKNLWKEILNFQNELDSFVKDTNNKVINEIDNFSNDIKEALKNRYTKELELEEKVTNEKLQHLNDIKEESIRITTEIYDAKIKALDDELKAEEKADQDKEELKKINSLKQAMEYEHNEFNKAEMQKELGKLELDRNKRLHKESIEDQKSKLEEEKKNEIEHKNKLYELDKLHLERQLDDTKKLYEKKLDMANLQAEAEKLIVRNNQEEIVLLLKSYSNKYEEAGTTLGEKLAKGMTDKINPVLDMIQSIEDRINSMKDAAVEAAKHIETDMLIVPSYPGAPRMETTNNNSSQTVINNNIALNSPKALSHSEQRRQLETTLRKLNFSTS